MPCTISSLTLMQFTPGNLYTSCGAERAPARLNTPAPTSSSSPVVTPGAAAARMAASASRTTAPAAFRPARSCSDSIDMRASLLLRRVRGCRGGSGGRRALVLLEQPALLDFLLPHVLVRDHELDAAVLRHVEVVRVRRDRLRLPVALHRELVRVERRELLQDVRAHRVRARLRQLLVRGRRAARVRVAADLELQLR